MLFKCHMMGTTKGKLFVNECFNSDLEAELKRKQLL